MISTFLEKIIRNMDMFFARAVDRKNEIISRTGVYTAIALLAPTKLKNINPKKRKMYKFLLE